MNATPTPAPDALSTSTPVSQDALEQMRRWVKDGAARWRRLILLEAMGIAIAAPLAYLWLVFIIDNVFHLPVLGRLVAILIFFGVLGFLARRLWRDWKQTQLTDDEVALAIERHTPGGLQNRLINAIQVSRQPEDAAHASESDLAARQAMLRENYHHLSKVRLQQAAQVKPAVIRVFIAAAMVLFGVGFYAFNRDQFTNAAARIFMPFAAYDPIYETRLTIEPGNVRVGAGDDVIVTIRIEGTIPSDLVVLKDTSGDRSSVSVPVAPNARVVTYTLPRVMHSMVYAVRGGDFTTSYYSVDVPITTDLRTLQARMEFPAYTKLPPRETEAVGGDLDALFGTNATLRFTFNQTVEEAVMIVERVVSSAPATTQPGVTQSSTQPGVNGVFERVTLTKTADNAFTGQITFKDVVGYRLETKRAGSTPETSRVYNLRVTEDLEPSFDLTGLDQHREATVDAIMPLTASGRDDFGLREVGVFYRAIKPKAGGVTVEKSAAPAPPAAAPAAAAKAEAKTDVKPAAPAAAAEPTAAQATRWETIQVWPVPNEAAAFTSDYSLAVASLNVVEGEMAEVMIRGRDTDPRREGVWTEGPSYRFLVGGKDAMLQLTYEQILRSETELRGLIESQTAAMRAADDWTRKLEPASKLRWDDKANLDALVVAMKQQAATQSALRQTAADTAKAMVEQAGNLRISVGMLSDTEFVRAIRIIEQVPTRDTVQSKRSALADARLTQERTVRSLNEILESYVEFRREWELANMTAFTKMLADREAAMASNSRTLGALPAGSTGQRQQEASQRRQLKLGELTVMAQQSFADLGTRGETIGEILAGAFAQASKDLAATELTASYQRSAQYAGEGKWNDAADQQELAAKALALVHLNLRKAQADAAQEAMAGLKELRDSTLEAQKEIGALREGSTENLIDVDLEQLEVKDIVHMQDVAKKERDKKQARPADGGSDYMFEEHMKSLLQAPDDGKRQEFKNLSLAKTPGSAMSFPNSSDREGNAVKPHIQKEFEDLVGELLDEADDLREDYDTYNMNAAFTLNEAGDVSKSGGDLNSTAAAAATGNQKPPPHDSGGVSRTGRKGGRAHGLNASTESVERHGNDDPMDGQEEVPDQAGMIKETKSGEQPKEPSPGMGGKQVGDGQNHFNTSDKGEFNEKVIDKMRPPQAKDQRVERAGKPIDPRVADALRDLDSKQEQLIERIKAVRKELRNLYLPTDDLDAAIEQLTANLEKLKDQPAGEVFRSQIETLDKLKSTVVVFNRASSAFQPSLPRDQAVKGSILDEPAWQTIPGYEDAVSRYYQNLAGQRNAMP